LGTTEGVTAAIFSSGRAREAAIFGGFVVVREDCLLFIAISVRQIGHVFCLRLCMDKLAFGQICALFLLQKWSTFWLIFSSYQSLPIHLGC
jgi:hypothetical protein